MYWSAWPAMQATRALGRLALEEFLLARHLLIDRLLEAAIERGGVTQVIEIAAGMSPRGWRFAERYGDRVTYIETDLPEMAERKRAALEAGRPARPARTGSRPSTRSRDEGERSLAAIAAGLDPARGLAIVTEGLLTYLDRDSVLGLWRRCAPAIAPFPTA